MPDEQLQCYDEALTITPEQLDEWFAMMREADLRPTPPIVVSQGMLDAVMSANAPVA